MTHSETVFDLELMLTEGAESGTGSPPLLRVHVAHACTLVEPQQSQQDIQQSHQEPQQSQPESTETHHQLTSASQPDQAPEPEADIGNVHFHLVLKIDIFEYTS